jgi:hypothetical protein
MSGQAQLQITFAAGNDGKFPEHQDLLPHYASSPEYGIYNNEVHDSYKNLVKDPEFFVCPLMVKFGGYFKDPYYTESWGNWWYGGWCGEYVSGTGNEDYQVVVMSYSWYANFKPLNEEIRYQDGELKWPRVLSECTSKTAFISHTLITGQGAQDYVYDRGHGGSDTFNRINDFFGCSTTYESPVTYGDGHVDANKKSEIKLRAGYKAGQNIVKVFY